MILGGGGGGPLSPGKHTPPPHPLENNEIHCFLMILRGGGALALPNPPPKNLKIDGFLIMMGGGGKHSPSPLN